MSAYASLPGSFLPPFFSFGGASTTQNNDGDSSGPCVSSHGDGERQDPTEIKEEQQLKPTSTASCPDFSRHSSSDTKSHELYESTSSKSTSSSASEIFIAINNARVDTVQLIQSLTTRGSNIARRTANFISRSSEANESISTTTYKRCGTNDSDAQTLQSKPSLCYDDSDDSDDDDMSFYNYDDNFHDHDSYKHEVEEEHSVASKTSQDEDAIQFELFINFNGREYRAFRAFSTFVQLRNDLLRDRTVPATVSIPELPSLSHDQNNSSVGTGFHALASSGFAMLQATAKMYCPVMELWLRSVVEVVPSSPILNRFLWEPLASSTAGWNDINEMEGDECDFESLSVKPIQQPRNKPRQNSNPSLRYMRSRSYNTSLSSITELLDES